MDFFEAQERARRRSKRLVLLFALAVLGTIVATYLIAMLFANESHRLDDSVQVRRTYAVESDARGALLRWWDPKIFLSTAGITLAVIGIASLYKWNQLRSGGAAVAEMVGGRRVDLQTTDFRERQLLNVVEEMSIASGIPVPAVFVLDEEPALNAFAAGLNTSDAAVAVTRGTLEKLTRDELQGVIAHEFSHILNGDMRLNVRITAIVFGILVLGLIGRSMLQSIGRGTHSHERKEGQQFRDSPGPRLDPLGPRLHRLFFRPADSGRRLAATGVPRRRLRRPVHPQSWRHQRRAQKDRRLRLGRPDPQ